MVTFMGLMFTKCQMNLFKTQGLSVFETSFFTPFYQAKMLQSGIRYFDLVSYKWLLFLMGCDSILVSHTISFCVHRNTHNRLKSFILENLDMYLAFLSCT